MFQETAFANANLPIPAVPSVEENGRQVDRILQLAKLGSNPEAIDPLLDVLRAVTAKWDGHSPMDYSNQARLQDLEAKLKIYLINEDPLRKFTPESLEALLSSGTRRHIVIKRNLVVILLTSTLAAGVALALPLFSFPANKSLLLTVPLFLVTLHIGIAWLYFSALSNFKTEFRRAFVWICAGILLLSVVFSHYVAIELLGLGSHPLFRYGGFLWLATASYGCIYFGLRQYARLLGIRSFFTSLRTLAGVGLAVVVAATLAPHTGQQTFEPYFDFSLSCMWLFTMFLAFGAGVARQITKNVTIAYAKSMKWLYIYLILGFVGSFGGTIGLPIVGQLNGGLLYTLIAIMGISPQLLLLYTGYSFKKETSI